MPDPLSYAQVQWAHTRAHVPPSRRFAPKRHVGAPTVLPSEGEPLAPTAYTADAKLLTDMTKALLDIKA
jgi:hypothetical protein